MVELALNGMRDLRRMLSPLWSPYGLILLVFALIIVFDPSRTVEHALFAAEALLGTLPYIIVAVALIAYLKATGAEAMIAKAFQGNINRMIVLAALFGGLAPFCSCQVIPFIAGMLALGVPIAPVMAFWLSSPLIDPPTLLITASALGWPFAVAKAAGAVGLGLFGGYITHMLIKGGVFADPLRVRQTNSCGCGPSPFDGRPAWRFWGEADRRQSFRNEAVENFLFLFKWLALAYVLEAVLIAYVPAELIGSIIGGNGFFATVLGAVVGAPAYLNSYIAPPLVAGLMEQGMGAGPAMAFMMAGAVSCIPAMAAVWSLVKPRMFALYVGLGITGAILTGLVWGMVG